jgi:hypothetical protein
MTLAELGVQLAYLYIYMTLDLNSSVLLLSLSSSALWRRRVSTQLGVIFYSSMFLSRENSFFASPNNSTTSLYDGYHLSRTPSLTGPFEMVDSSANLNSLNPPVKIRPSSALTEKIIIEISKSIKIFKPSRSLYQLTLDSQSQNTYQEDARPLTSIDVVISGHKYIKQSARS